MSESGEAFLCTAIPRAILDAEEGKNWTPFAFFSSADGGLGLDVAGDQDTKKAI